MRTFLQILFCLVSSYLYAQEGYHAVGFASDYDHDKRSRLMSGFLPYNPNILVFSSKPEIYLECSRAWSKGSFFYVNSPQFDPTLAYDLFWLEQEGGELETLTAVSDLLSKVKIVYTTTHLHENGIHFQRLKDFLEDKGFEFLTHWYWENQHGNALFLRKNIYDIVMGASAHRPPSNFSSQGSEIQPFFRSATNKSSGHCWDEIDFIYMINLDERPEKFALTSTELQLYGINPYRFSAVNGWALPTAIFDKIGVKFSPETPKEQFFGLTYKEIDGEEFLSHEFIRGGGTAYFTRGLARGPVGIILSHLSVLQDAYDSGYKTIWVMEDDVEVVGDPKLIPHLIQDLDLLAPDWDIFFTDTDTKDNMTGQHIPCRAIATRPNVPVPSLAVFLGRFYSIGYGLYRTGMRYGAYSMIIRHAGMKKILDYYKTYHIFLPYDMDYWLCPNLKMFHFEKDIVSHRVGSPSNNSIPIGGFDENLTPDIIAPFYLLGRP